jgi:hypothetical protein
MTKPGIALADMTSVHQELLRTKAYVDMTGNGLNHPNDFLTRWYAQVIGSLLVVPAGAPQRSSMMWVPENCFGSFRKICGSQKGA